MLPLYELLLDDESDEIFAISAVESPAIMSDWVYFNKSQEHFNTINKEKRLIVGTVLIPNRKILRLNAEGEEYEVYISPETVKKAAHLYMKKKYQDNVTLEHEKSVDDIVMVESWIKEGDEDKSTLYGLDAPVGSWVSVFKVNNDEIWNSYVKTGKVKGWSIEGLFSQEYRGMTDTEMELMSKPIDQLSDDEAEIVLGKIKEMLENPSVASTYPGSKAKDNEYISEALLSDLRAMLDWYKKNVKEK